MSSEDTQAIWESLKTKEREEIIKYYLDIKEYDFIMNVSNNPPLSEEILLRVISEVPGWVTKHCVFSTTVPENLLMACLNSKDGYQWLKLLCEKSIAKQVANKVFIVAAIDQYPDIITIPGVMHGLDPSVFKTKIFKKALKKYPDAINYLDENNCKFTEVYKYWDIESVKVFGTGEFDLSNIKYRLDPVVKDFIEESNGTRRITRSASKKNEISRNNVTKK